MSARARAGVRVRGRARARVKERVSVRMTVTVRVRVRVGVRVRARARARARARERARERARVQMTVRVRVRVKMRVRHGVMRRLAAGRSVSAARRLAGRLLRRPVWPECGLPPAGFATARRPTAEGADALDFALGFLGSFLTITPRRTRTESPA